MGNMHFRCNGQSLFCWNQIIFNICQIMHSQYIHLCINRNLYYALFLIIPIVIAACVLYYLMLCFILACPVILIAWLPIIEPQYCPYIQHFFFQKKYIQHHLVPKYYEDFEMKTEMWFNLDLESESEWLSLLVLLHLLVCSDISTHNEGRVCKTPQTKNQNMYESTSNLTGRHILQLKEWEFLGLGPDCFDILIWISNITSLPSEYFLERLGARLF